MRLIVNADDFGLTRGVNLGIIEALQRGVVRSATLMAQMPATDHAIALSKGFPELAVGVHLCLTYGEPMSDNVPTLLDDSGSFQTQRAFWENQSMNPAEIEKELQAQIDHVLAQGLEISHLDGHHHCHRHALVAPAAEKLAARYAIPLRPVNGKVRYKGKSLAFSEDFYGKGASEAAFLATVKHFYHKVDVLEIMVHPGLVDEPLLQTSRYAMERAHELAVLSAATLPEKLAELGVTPDNYTCFSVLD